MFSPRPSPQLRTKVTSRFPGLPITAFVIQRLVVASCGCQSDCQEKKTKGFAVT